MIEPKQFKKGDLLTKDELKNIVTPLFNSSTMWGNKLL